MADDEELPVDDDDDDLPDGLDDDEEEEEEEDEQEEAHFTDASAIKEVQDKTFDEVTFTPEIIEEVQSVWNHFINANSREAIGEAVYAALFDAAPSLQSLFKTPRAVMSVRILNGFSSIINAMGTPSQLRIATETLGFQHLDLEVTVPRVIIFRDAIIDLLEMEVGMRFTSRAKSGIMSVLNYVGGAFIYVRVNYSERLKVIASSWATANNKTSEDTVEQEGEEDAEGVGEEEENEEQEHNEEPKRRKSVNDDQREKEGEEDKEEGKDDKKSTMKVPQTFDEMFTFNAAVMGFGGSVWFEEVLEVFDEIVLNVSNSYRLQEACDTLALTLAKYKGTINLAEYKAVMLASLRSLCPKDWDTNHEVAWSWLWENVERMLKDLMGKPQVQEKALERFIMSLTEDSVNYLRREVYKRFFALAPAGQDFFKQSTTRLYWIADKVVEQTMEMYREPKKMKDVLSATGLRHVGYGVLTEFFAPYVSGAVEVVRSMTSDEFAEDGFRWSLSLIARILVRTINEGSTIVMKAVNANAGKALRKAVSIAPRGKRSLWMLNITVGTQSISPLYWAIESSSLNTANAMLRDLLMIRADRDNYYYGYDDLFERHPEIIQRLCTDAPALLPTLLDGLIWRSRLAANGLRRVNYYIKHLVTDEAGDFNQALAWLCEHNDPKIICHPANMLFSDLIWSRLASKYFLRGRLYFLFTLLVFIASQCVLSRYSRDGTAPGAESVRIATFACRCFVYMGSLGQLLKGQFRQLMHDIKHRNSIKVLKFIKLPAYLSSGSLLGELVLLVCLAVLCTQEPIFHCAGNWYGDYAGSGIFTQVCPEAKPRQEFYTTVSMIAMLLYWVLLLDLTIFSMHISAYVLVISRVLNEVMLFLCAMTYIVGTFACGISSLHYQAPSWYNVPSCLLSLMEIALGMFSQEFFTEIENHGVMFVSLCVFIILTVLFLMQLLVAQLNCAYEAVYEDMVGYARLNRGTVIVQTMAGVSKKRWSKFLDSLKFNDRLEFNEGDIGLAGGIQVLEPSNLNPTTVDRITRFGGSTSPLMQWPEDKSGDVDDEDDKYEKLEKSLSKISKKLDGMDGASSKKRNGNSVWGETTATMDSSTGSDDSE
eukprot:TRINITY_DN5208_c0_g1_i1.p1 TRINITY_DN5208_c0_g1~~TRINITY_DN5208_c0_g1_i1.p1  ORF type:complete len:1104 (+),score=248.48 TRINITY_DN5208_c0_g1_i1:34-3345(+)